MQLPKNLIKELRTNAGKVLVAVLLLTMVLILIERINDWIFTVGPEELKALFVGLGVWSVPVFLGLYVVFNILLTPSYPFVFTSGIVYGIFWGTVISLVAEVLSATANYLLGRTFGSFFHHSKKKKSRIARFTKYIQKHGFGFILLLRYLGLYFDVVSYAAGAVKIKYRPFILATALGFLPYILIYVFTGNMLLNVKSSSFIYFILGFKALVFVLFLIGLWLHKMRKHWLPWWKEHWMIVIGILAILVVTVSHTFFISSFQSFWYERVRDGLITILAIVLAWVHLKKKSNPALIAGLMYVLIATIHVLRLVFGGLPC